jgi:protein-S-isoprenylcysteine O-methyltransferase Ste14
VLRILIALGWIACVVYSTVPSFWLMIHPRADVWRARRQSPYPVLIPLWIGMWVVVASITWPWRMVQLYSNLWGWVPAIALFATGIWLYRQAGVDFGWKELGGVPELHHRAREQRLVTTGIRARVRHPVYLAHLLEMLAWSLGTGLAVCYVLTAFAIVSGLVMIRMEDQELEARFGEAYRAYRHAVPSIIPGFHADR